MKHVFISYSRTDAVAMQRIAQILRDDHIRVWTDEKLTPGSADWQFAIQKAIDGADAVVVLLSPDAKDSEWVARELTYAHMRKIVIFPLLLRGDPTDAVPFQVINAQWVDLRADEQFDQGMSTLAQALKALVKNHEQNRFVLIHEELKSLVERNPQIMSVGLISVDGLSIGFYSRSPNAEEDRLAAMSAAGLSLGERISSELGAGDWHFAVISGHRGRIFQMLAGEDAVLIAVVEGTPSIDSILNELTASSERLMKY